MNARTCEVLPQPNRSCQIARAKPLPKAVLSRAGIEHQCVVVQKTTDVLLGLVSLCCTNPRIGRCFALGRSRWLRMARRIEAATDLTFRLICSRPITGQSNSEFDQAALTRENNFEKATLCIFAPGFTTIVKRCGAGHLIRAQFTAFCKIAAAWSRYRGCTSYASFCACLVTLHNYAIDALTYYLQQHLGQLTWVGMHLPIFPAGKASYAAQPASKCQSTISLFVLDCNQIVWKLMLTW